MTKYIKHPIVRYSVIFGSIAAIFCVFIALIQFYALHACPFGRYKAPAYGINIIFIFVSIWYYRIHRGGYLSFGEGFVVGMLTNLIAAFLTGFMLYFFTKYIDNQPVVLWMQENILTIERMKDVQIKQFGEATYQQLLAASHLLPSPSTVMIDEIAKKQFCIVAITLISLILRRNPETIS